ncbi:hypothetical protein SDC9_102691 [bioreactor metagenome]|uniref:Uncharacterized protein n=1 Tax=bioreactor metagenome TaxID=1076179 RepID=A0A645AYD6_9ZZZZ
MSAHYCHELAFIKTGDVLVQRIGDGVVVQTLRQRILYRQVFPGLPVIIVNNLIRSLQVRFRLVAVKTGIKRICVVQPARIGIERNIQEGKNKIPGQ